jgi:ribonuclease P protein component
MGERERLRKNSQFTAVYERGRTSSDGFVVLKTMPNGLEWNRYGFVAGKRLGKAVVRNRVKRLLREVVRATPTKSGWDVVFIARSKAAAANYHELEASVAGLLRRAKILADNDGARGIGGAEE